MESEQLPDRFRRAVASMWLGDHFYGHLFLDPQPSVQVDNQKVKKHESFESLAARFPERLHEIVDWMIVFAEPEPDRSPYTDGTTDRIRELREELENSVFAFRGTTYQLRWLEGPERMNVLRDVFGFDWAMPQHE